MGVSRMHYATMPVDEIAKLPVEKGSKERSDRDE